MNYQELKGNSRTRTRGISRFTAIKLVARNILTRLLVSNRQNNVPKFVSRPILVGMVPERLLLSRLSASTERDNGSVIRIDRM